MNIIMKNKSTKHVEDVILVLFVLRIYPTVTEQDPMGSPHVLCLPLVCRKAVVSQASPELQKPGSTLVTERM